MSRLWEQIEEELSHVRSPSQYIGGEWNSIRKEGSDIRVKVAFAFPDAYTIGMSHLGLQIIYGMLNAVPHVACERIFAPMPDMEDRMRAAGIPLFSLETHTPAKDFQIVGFSLQSELQYTNVLNMLELAAIPLRSAERESGEFPLIVGGGPCAFYPEPLADAFDLFIIGDGEDAVMKLVELLDGWKGPKKELLKAIAAQVPGAYVPSLYRVEYRDDNRLGSISASDGVPCPVARALVPSMDGIFYPSKPIVPFAEVVHDRINLEIMRGCPHRCRFCQAVNVKNKLRFRDMDTLLRLAEENYANTGHDEIALTSLSSGDYPDIAELMTRLNARFKARRVSVSLPSLRIDEKLKDIPPLLKTVRKTGFTIAPEAGTESLRMILKKSIRDQDLFDTARSAFKEGWKHIKLYFIIGFPFETDDDVRGIIHTAKKISAIRKELGASSADVNVTISPFVPKPHTPLQWCAMESLAIFREKTEMLSRMCKGTRIHLKTNDPKKSFVEAVLARGDRRLLNTLVAARRQGCRFDEWGEHFMLEKWLKAFGESGIDAEFYARRAAAEDEVFPWDHLSSSVPKDFLLGEFKRCMASVAKRSEPSPEIPNVATP